MKMNKSTSLNPSQIYPDLLQQVSQPFVSKFQKD